MSILSKKARYALHGLAYIAHASGVSEGSAGEPVRFEDILRYLRAYAPELTLSPSYLAKLFQVVSRAGLTEAIPGPRGGYRLARAPEAIRLIEVVEAVDGSQRTGCCLLSVGVCHERMRCGVGELTQAAEQAFYSVFEQRTLADLAGRMSFPELGPAGG